jgi:hypothetical protein
MPTTEPIAIHVALYDEDLTSPIANATPDSMHTIGPIEMSWYERARRFGYSAQSRKAFEAAFGPPQMVRKYEDSMSVWTFQRGDAVAWALVSPRGVYWEWPSSDPVHRADPARVAETITLVHDVLESSLQTLALHPHTPAPAHAQ